MIVLLLGVMAFSGYKIIDQLLIYKKGQNAYEDLRSQVLQTGEAPSTLATKPWNVPVAEPSGEKAAPVSREESVTAADDERGDITYDPLETLSGEMQIIPWWNVDFEMLRTINPDVKAWLYGMDGMVNYPVVQGKDNEYYDHRLLDGTEQFCGTLFADCRNDFLKDDITYIYGHKMKDGSMFGHFGKYDTYAYYATHPTIRLFTPSEVYELQVIACVYTTKWEPLHFTFENEEAFNEIMEDYQRRSQFRTAVDIEYGDQFVCLWTCAYYREDGRMFILCKAVRTVE
ncbi:MAG: class B sortase [Lachnospiraceae bacterium]|nr:class B sortase [Lachnospiraceae bacterium]